jgi:hypothetical protein
LVCFVWCVPWFPMSNHHPTLFVLLQSPWQKSPFSKRNTEKSSCCSHKYRPNLFPGFVPKVRGVRGITCKKDSSKGVDFGVLDGSALRVGIVYARWNDTIVRNLLKACKETLVACKVDPNNTVEFEVGILVTYMPWTVEPHCFSVRFLDRLSCLWPLGI